MVCIYSLTRGPQWRSTTFTISITGKSNTWRPFSTNIYIYDLVKTKKKGKRYVDYAPLAAAPLRPW